MPDLQPVVMENVRVLFRNFSGKEDMYNREGDRNFSVALPGDVADAMARDGWLIKMLKPREEGDEGQPYIPVAVSYKVRPPHVYIITSRGRTALGEAEIAMLDWAEITNVDLILNPYQWEVNGKQGIKAYLGSLFVTIEEDPLEQKYASIPLAGSNEN